MNAETLQYWRPYQPTQDQPRTFERVAHLHRRAGFGANWKQLHRDLQLEPTEVVSQVFAPDIHEEFKDTCSALRDGLKSSLDPQSRLQAYWIFRLAFDPDPLTEKVTLFWHNHFATGNQKVGNYGEDDIRAAARCLTGQRLSDATEPQIEFDLSRFDAGTKTILGQTGNFGQDDLVRTILEQPACARFLCNKLYKAFVSDTVTPEPQAITELAEFYANEQLLCTVGVGACLSLGTLLF